MPKTSKSDDVVKVETSEENEGDDKIFKIPLPKEDKLIKSEKSEKSEKRKLSALEEILVVSFFSY